MVPTRQPLLLLFYDVCFVLQIVLAKSSSGGGSGLEDESAFSSFTISVSTSQLVLQIDLQKQKTKLPKMVTNDAGTLQLHEIYILCQHTSFSVGRNGGEAIMD